MNRPSSTASRSYALDWFRGLGILGVIWGHAGLPGIPGAYLFIDSFFTISGFLVSQSLIRSVDLSSAGRSKLFKSVLTFLENRVRRILIPLAAAVLLTLVVGWYVMLPDHLFGLASSARATLLLRAHLYSLTLGSYFDVVGQSAPLLHAWSLSLEEWFYLITPIIVLPALLWKRWWWMALLAIVAILSFARADSLSSDPQMLGASYSMFSTRLWQFLVGAIGAIMFSQGLVLPKPVNDCLILLGLGAVFGSVLVLTNKAPSPGVVTLPTTFGVLAVLMLQPVSQRLKTITGSASLRFFGRRLYSLYLAHYPVMVYFDYIVPESGLTTGFIKLILGVCFGLLFFKIFEAPMRGWRDASFAWVLGLSAIFIVPAIVLSGHIISSGGAPNRLSDAALIAMAGRFDTNPMRAVCLESQLTLHSNSCVYGSPELPFVALFGDSHSDAIAFPLAQALSQYGIGVRHFWYAECPVIGSGLEQLDVFSDACNNLSHEAHRFALRAQGLVGAVYVARWPWYLAADDQNVRRAYWRDAKGLPRGQPDMIQFRSDFTRIFAESASAFAERNVPVHILSPLPRLPTDPVKAQVLDLWRNWDWQRKSLDHSLIQRQNAEDRRIFDEVIQPLVRAGLMQVLDSAEVMCDRHTCMFEGLKTSFYYDDNHLNGAGAKHLIVGFQKLGILNHLWLSPVAPKNRTLER